MPMMRALYCGVPPKFNMAVRLVLLLLYTRVIFHTARCRYVPFVVGVVLWLYLRRAKISENVSFAYRSVRSIMIVSLRRAAGSQLTAENLSTQGNDDELL